MKSIVVTEYGSTDNLELHETETPEPTPSEVRIDVETAGINFADIIQRRGAYQDGPEPSYTLGMEAAGTVDAVGEGVNRRVGERVVAVTDGGVYAGFVTTPAPTLFDVPELMSFAEAAGFPVQFLTVCNCLHEWDDLGGDEHMLIQAAASGVGTTAVQLASHADVKTFGTASIEAKLDLAADLGFDCGIQYTEEDFREVVTDETDGAGIDLVLDGVGGGTSQRSLDALADFGRFVAYGTTFGNAARADPTRLLFENKLVIDFHLGSAMQQRPKSIPDAMPELSGLLTMGELDVIIDETFALRDAAAAYEYIEAKRSSKKVVLKP